MSYKVGIDVGGTFTDVLLVNQKNGKMYPIKTPSTNDDQSKGVQNGIKEVCELVGIKENEINQVLHGTTVATNAVLEEKGAKVGLIVTKGFKHMLHLARGYTPAPLFGWMKYEKPNPLASVENTFEIDEKIDSEGNILKSINEDEIKEVIDKLIKSDIESITISLFNSYTNTEHERKVKEIIQRLHPNIPISTSTDILMEFKEYERTLTAVMNSYVKPKMSKYLNNLEEKLKLNGINSHINIVRSDNGLMSIEKASENPVHTMLSGPSGGVKAAAYIGELINEPNLITFDMGGTSTDVSVIRNGQISMSRDSQVGEFPVKSPSVEIESIGAGGGSIAHVPEITNVLRVGPESAGSNPGPVCYGKGGTEPTVTDANLVLNRLPESLLDGEMKLDVDAAKNAVSKVAKKLNIDIYDAAQGIIDIVNENMFGAIRVVSVEKGLDSRDFGLVGFGGAGPLNANSVAMLSGSFPVVIPPEPGVLSSMGFNISDYKQEFTNPFIKKTKDTNIEDVFKITERLKKDANDWFINENIDENNRKIDVFIDVRYYLQGFEIPIRIEEKELRESNFENIERKFNEIHERLYKFKMNTDIEIVNIRVVALGITKKIQSIQNKLHDENPENAIIEKKPVYFDGQFIDTVFYHRDKLLPGNKIIGPAIIVQYDTTTVILPNNEAKIDEFNNIIINKV